MGYETILAMHVRGKSEWNGGGRSSVFIHNKNSGGPHEHPTMKPERLMTELISLFSVEGGIVLDPFLGAGTTALVALKAGRDFVGIELNAEYVAMAEKRIAPYRNRLPW